MGVEAADYDGDGKLDFYVTAYQTQGGALFRNVAQGLFQDVTLSTRAATGTVPNVTWGCATGRLRQRRSPRRIRRVWAPAGQRRIV